MRSPTYQSVSRAYFASLGHVFRALCGVSLAHRFDMGKDAHPIPRAESFPLDRGSVATCSISIVKAWVSFVLDEYLECVA